MEKLVIQVEDLKTYLYLRRGIVKAVDRVNFTVKKGETVGLVGESGSGKTMTALSIVRLIPKPAGHIVGGRILFGGDDLVQKTEAEMRKIRGAGVAMILQDPMTSLNPVFTVGSQIGEGIYVHQQLRRARLREQILETLRLVRVPSPEIRADQFPGQLSGGMRQRVVGAVAISCAPQLLIADEPTTSLDVTIQAQYLNLLKDIQQEMGMAMLFITHDFGIVAKMCDRVCVMYAGKIVESAMVRDLFDRPVHPYTKALLGSLPKPGKRTSRLFTIEGQPPELLDLPHGCSFAPRCSERGKECDETPPLVTVGDDHSVLCWQNGKTC